MKSRIIWVTISVLILLSMILASCAQETSSPTSSTSSTPPQTTESTPPTSSTEVTTTTPPETTTPTQANWWDKFGTPKYGGTIAYTSGAIMGVNWDVYSMVGADNDFYYESLFEPSWTLDRKIWAMTGQFYPDEYWSGNLAESWEITDPTTITVKLRQGVHWQNKAPVNGREFVASDVQAHYDRILGTGGGYTQPAPMYAGAVSTWDRVTATDKYTVVFKFKVPSAQNFQTIADRWALNEIEAPEWVALGGPPPTTTSSAEAGGPPAEGGPPPAPPLPSGPLGDWHTVVGTGPWMLTDYLAGSSFTFSKNPDYWGMDPRYPQNQVPYADTLSRLIIPDSSTQLAALRTGKIDQLSALTWQQAQQLTKSNPEIQQQNTPAGASGIGLRVDKKPFTDIRVRQALDMAIDRQSIAKNFYGGTSDGLPVGIITSDYTGYAYAYADWPQDLKDQYAYNPTKAKQLLADAGYPNGFDTNVVTTSDAVGLQLMQVFQSYFKDIGINMEIRPMDTAAEQAFTRAGKHDQMSGQGIAQTFPPTRIIDIYYSTGGTDAVYYGLNNAPDATYDKLHDEFLAATDPDQARQIFQQMDKEIIEQHITIAAPQSVTYNVWQPYLKGYSGETFQWGAGITWSRLWTEK